MPCLLRGGFYVDSFYAEHLLTYPDVCAHLQGTNLLHGSLHYTVQYILYHANYSLSQMNILVGLPSVARLTCGQHLKSRLCKVTQSYRDHNCSRESLT